MRLSERKGFLSRVKKEKTGCWIWLGTKSHKYGAIVKNKKQIGAHRQAYIFFRGPIPEGMYICHHCDNPACVNPDHLFLGTHTDNMRDCVRKKRHNKPIGEKHHKATLTEPLVKLIKIMFARGYSNKDIAEKLKLPPG